MSIAKNVYKTKYLFILNDSKKCLIRALTKYTRYCFWAVLAVYSFIQQIFDCPLCA